MAASEASRTPRQRWLLFSARRAPGFWRRRPCYAEVAAADTSAHVCWMPGAQWRRRRPARHAGCEGSHSCAQLSRCDICPAHSHRSVPRWLALSNARVGYLGRDVGEVVTHDAALAVVSRMPRPRRRYFRGPQIPVHPKFQRRREFGMDGKLRGACSRLPCPDTCPFATLVFFCFFRLYLHRIARGKPLSMCMK